MARILVVFLLLILAAPAADPISVSASDVFGQRRQEAVVVESTRATSWHARHIGTAAQQIEIRGFARLSRRIALSGTRIRVRTLLAERSSGSELVRRRGGLDAAPMTLPQRNLYQEGNRAIYSNGKAPKVHIVLNRSSTRVGDPSREIGIRLQIDGGGFHRPRHCIHQTRRAHTTLATHFIVIRGSNAILDIAITTRWSCRQLTS